MPTIVHFDVAAEKPERAKQFYESLFGWNIINPSGMPDYFLIDTKDLDGSKGVGGGLGMRGDPSQRITVYIGVDNIDDYCSKVEMAGGKVIQPKMTVPGWGWLAVCIDTEGNTFGLWQDDKENMV